MKLKVLLVAALGIGVTMWFAGHAFAQHDDHGHSGHDHAAHGDNDEADMMALWAKMSAPGEHHKHLNAFVGKWNYVLKWRMSPEQPWTNDKGTAENEWILGGRYVRQHARALKPDEVMGMQFEGNGILGYDNLKHKHFSAWIDNAGTGMAISEGTCDGSEKTITLTGTHADPITGKEKTDRSVYRVINDDKHTLTMYEIGPDGKEYMSMEITYTRK